MSPLSNDTLNIALCPEQIFLQGVRHSITLRGRKRHVLGGETLHFGAEGETPWSAALEALGSALPRHALRGAQASVILSNHFVNYTLVPWCEGISDQEDLAHAAHCFKEEFGDHADSWEIRVSPNRAQQPALASAVDAGLLGQLREVLGGAGLSIRSVQPHLMLAYNSSQAVLRRRNAWLVLLEPGRLCLAVLRDGSFSWVRMLRIGSAWHEEMPLLLEREAYLAEGGADSNEVLLWAPQLAEGGIMEDVVPEWGHWNVRRLRSAAWFGNGRSAA